MAQQQQRGVEGRASSAHPAAGRAELERQSAASGHGGAVASGFALPAAVGGVDGRCGERPRRSEVAVCTAAYAPKAARRGLWATRLAACSSSREIMRS